MLPRTDDFDGVKVVGKSMFFLNGSSGHWRVSETKSQLIIQISSGKGLGKKYDYLNTTMGKSFPKE